MPEPLDPRVDHVAWPGRLGYGVANLGNLYRAIDDDHAWQILDAAWEAGVRHFDTAPHYGLGLSERRLGKFLATKPREQFVVSTKVGRLLVPHPEGAGSLDTDHDFMVPADLRRVWDFSAAGVRRSVEESLERLGLGRVDVVYLHDPERYDLQRGLEEGLTAAARLREEAVVSAVGVGSMVTSALQAAADTGLVDLLMVAGRLTLVDHATVATLLARCERDGVGVVAAAVFNSGLLAADEPSARARFDYQPVPPGLLERARRIARIGREHGVPLPVAALHFPLRYPAVRSVVVGGASPEQVRENAARLDRPVPEEFWERLARAGLIEE